MLHFLFGGWEGAFPPQAGVELAETTMSRLYGLFGGGSRL